MCQCFLAGDDRVNEHPGLTMIHTILAREHNRVAAKLREINSEWSEERVYQESRRIVGALIQHITFAEFLPRVLGPEVMKENSLDLLQSGYFTGYRQDCDHVMLNEFSGAAFRSRQICQTVT